VEYYFSEHAQQEIKRRYIPLEYVETTLKNPQQITEEREQRQCYQSLITIYDIAVCSRMRYRQGA